MKRRLLAFLLAITLCLGLIGGLGSCTKPANKETAAYVTRGDWIAYLAATFGMDGFENAVPFFSDVSDEQPLFPFVQSCCEWNVLDASGGKFDAEAVATKDFVGRTAVLAAELDYSGYNDPDPVVQCAIANGIISRASMDDKLEDGVTAAECEAALRVAKHLYLNKEVVPYENITLNPDVIDLSFVPTRDTSATGNTMTFLSADVADLKPGDIFIAPGDRENPDGIAKKVVSVEYKDGEAVVVTEEPGIEEVFDELDFSMVSAPSYADIVPGEPGITIVPFSSATDLLSDSFGHTLTDLSDADGYAATPLKNNPLSFGVNVNLTKGKLEPNIGFFDWINGEASARLDDIFKSKSSKTLPESTKKEAEEIFKRTHAIMGKDAAGNPVLQHELAYKGGYEIIGSITLKNLYIETSCELEKGLFGIPCGVKEYSSELHYELEASLSFKGKLEAELLLWSTVIPGPWGIWISLELYLCLEANGELSFKLTANHTSALQYSSGSYKKTSETTLTKEFEVSASLWGGAKGQATLKILGIKIVDVAVKAGGGLVFDPELHIAPAAADTPQGETPPQSELGSMLCFEIMTYFPTVNISIGTDPDTLAFKIGLKATFKIIDRKDALIPSAEHVLWHWELSGDGAHVVPACTWDDRLAAENAESAEEDPGGDETDQDADNPYGMLIIQDVLITLVPGGKGQIIIASMPGGMTVQDLLFESKDTSVVVVDQNGDLTAIAPGSTQVYVTAKNGDIQVCAIHVLSAAQQTGPELLPPSQSGGI